MTRHGGIHRWNVSSVESTGSTNVDLLAALERGDAGDRSALRADHQTHGRGRLDRTWEAPAGANLLVSLAFGEVPTHPVRLTQAVGVAALEAIEGLTAPLDTAPVRLELKWPNDILLDGRKLAGILAQRASNGAVVVGIGLNVGWSPPGAAHLTRDAGLDVTPSELLDVLLVRLDDHLESSDREQHARYVERLGTLGRRIRLVLPDGSELVADADGVELDGRLSVVDLDGRARIVDVGDITHIRMLSDDPA